MRPRTEPDNAQTSVAKAATFNIASITLPEIHLRYRFVASQKYFQSRRKVTIATRLIVTERSGGGPFARLLGNRAGLTKCRRPRPQDHRREVGAPTVEHMAAALEKFPGYEIAATASPRQRSAHANNTDDDG
jgi:hypothetical protein